MCCRWGGGIFKDHNLLFLSMRKWPGSSRVPEFPKITMRPLHTWRKTTSLCTQTQTSDNHRTTTTPVPGSSPSGPDMTSSIELMVRGNTHRKWHRLCCKNTKRVLHWWRTFVQETKQISELRSERDEQQMIKGHIFNSQEKNAILLIFERSSIVHENICFGACHLTITFYEEKEIYREKKIKHYKPLTSH